MEREYDQREALYANQIAAAETRYATTSGVRGIVGSTLAPDKALMATRERVGMLIERTMEVAGRLEAIGDRAFGSVPTGKQESCAAPVRSGDMGAINDGLDTLGAQIARAHDAMTRLESL